MRQYRCSTWTRWHHCVPLPFHLYSKKEQLIVQFPLPLVYRILYYFTFWIQQFYLFRLFLWYNREIKLSSMKIIRDFVNMERNIVIVMTQASHLCDLSVSRLGLVINGCSCLFDWILYIKRITSWVFTIRYFSEIIIVVTFFRMIKSPYQSVLYWSNVQLHSCFYKNNFTRIERDWTSPIFTCGLRVLSWIFAAAALRLPLRPVFGVQRPLVCWYVWNLGSLDVRIIYAFNRRYFNTNMQYLTSLARYSSY